MWEEVFLTEEPKFEESSLKVNVGQLYLAEDYRERFTTLATNGWPWINLNVIGVSSGRLVLSVEVPGYPAEGAPFTSVNMSGPSKVVEENGFEVEVVENHGG